MSKKIIFFIIFLILVFGWVYYFAWFLDKDNNLENNQTNNTNNNTKKDLSIIESWNQENESKKQKIAEKVELLEKMNTKEEKESWWGLFSLGTMASSNTTYFSISSFRNSEKSFLSNINTYVNNLELQWFDDYNFKFIKNKSIKNSCDKNISIEELSVQNNKRIVFRDTIYNISILETIKSFKTRKERKEWDKLYILINDIDANCNNDAEIKEVKSLFWNKNNDIEILLLNNDIWEIKLKFLSDLFLQTWIKIKNINSEYDLLKFFSNNITPLPWMWWDEKEWDNNVFIDAYDKNKNNTSFELQILKKNSTTYEKVIDIEVDEKWYKWELNPWKYVFKIKDTLTWIEYKSEEVKVNSIEHFKRDFIFRNTKIQYNVLDLDWKPINATFELYDKTETLLRRIEKQSSFNETLTPWKYTLNILTENKFVFNIPLELKWETIISDNLITKYEKVNIIVNDTYWNTINNVSIKVFSWQTLLETLMWGNVDTKLWPWKYSLTIEDRQSWAMLKKDIVVRQDSLWEYFEFKFRTVETKIILGSNQRILEIRNADKYYRHIKDKYSKLKPIKKLSWKWTIKLNLLEWKYAIEVFDFNKEKLGYELFTIDNWWENEIKINY